MSKVTITYFAPKDDDRVVETRGVEFFAGQPVELDAEAHAELIAKARGNPHFVVEGDEPAVENPAPARRRAAQ